MSIVILISLNHICQAPERPSVNSCRSWRISLISVVFFSTWLLSVSSSLPNLTTCANTSFIRRVVFHSAKIDLVASLVSSMLFCIPAMLMSISCRSEKMLSSSIINYLTHQTDRKQPAGHLGACLALQRMHSLS